MMDKKTMDALYYEKNKERIKARRRERYQENREAELAKIKEYTESHKDRISEYQKQYRTDNADSLKQYKNEYYTSMHGRATRLANHYQREDTKHNRGNSTLTNEWIVDNIFSKCCAYCGETDWTKLGCDRIDNSKPHTEDNVVPCCWDCNRKKGTMSFEEFKEKMLGDNS